MKKSKLDELLFRYCSRETTKEENRRIELFLDSMQTNEVNHLPDECDDIIYDELMSKHFNEARINDVVRKYGRYVYWDRRAIKAVLDKWANEQEG